MSALDELHGLAMDDMSDYGCPNCGSTKSYDTTIDSCDGCGWSMPDLETRRVHNHEYCDTYRCSHCDKHLGTTRQQCDDCLISRGLMQVSLN